MNDDNSANNSYRNGNISRKTNDYNDAVLKSSNYNTDHAKENTSV